MWVCIWNEMKCCNDELRGKFWNDNLKNHMCREEVNFNLKCKWMNKESALLAILVC